MFFVMKLSKLCNLRCSYCYEFAHLANAARMPLDGLADFFSSLAEHYDAQHWQFPLRFVFHGGEPMLLPDDYIAGIVRAQEAAFGTRNIPYSNSLQTNLFKLDRAKADFISSQRIALGVSLDVFGDARVTAGGKPSQQAVIDNLQKLYDWDMVEELGVGAIAVLHAGNIARTVDIIRFYDALDMDCRLLPVFAIDDDGAADTSLAVSHAALLEAFKLAADAFLARTSGISVFPLSNFFDSALRHLLGVPTAPYAPRDVEWALIVDTNGDTFNHGDAYLPAGLMGNIFTQSFAALYDSADRQRTVATRAERAALCHTCPYFGACSGLPVIESLHSERAVDGSGNATCPIARPMIDYFVEAITQHPQASTLVSAASRRLAASPRADIIAA